MITRRQFLNTGAMTLGSFALPSLGFSLQGLVQEDPHFFLTLNFYGGWDHSYLFDARPLEMTQSGLIQNYTNSAPNVFGQGDAGPWLSSPVAKPLEAIRQDLCILKGVTMATTFDGHPQNVAYITTGNAFGGDSFLPVLNRQGKAKVKNIPLDTIVKGFNATKLTNGERTASLGRAEIKSIGDQLKQSPINQDQLDYQFLKNSYLLSAERKGGFGLGAQLLASASEKSIDFSKRLANIELNSEIDDEGIQGFVDMMGQIFKNQVGFSGELSDFYNLDSHDATSAKEHPQTVAQVVQDILNMIDFMKKTPFSKAQSLFDVTTLMITSEFSRTMRIIGAPIDDTGTNHNTFNNTIMLAGKGIRGGQIIGGTDFSSSDEELSKAHLQIDPIKEKIFGLPFDFTQQKAVLEKPEEFKLENYLNHKNIVNTLFSLFDVPREHWWTMDRNSPPAPTISRILA